MKTEPCLSCLNQHKETKLNFMHVLPEEQICTFRRLRDEYEQIRARLLGVIALLESGSVRHGDGSLPLEDVGRLKSVTLQMEVFFKDQDEGFALFADLHEEWHGRTVEWKTPPDLPQAAWLFAARKHQGQLYPGTELPYLTHIGLVLVNLTPALESQPLLDSAFAKCCAILHGTVEDTETTLEEIEAQFGQRVAAGVAALTKDKQKNKKDAMRDSLSRIREHPRKYGWSNSPTASPIWVRRPSTGHAKNAGLTRRKAL
jgi:hypothetical protein